METVYTPSQLRSRDLPALLVSSACVIGLFAILPLIIAIPQWDRDNTPPTMQTINEKLPDTIVEPEKPIIEKKEIEKPILEEKQLDINLTQLELALNLTGTVRDGDYALPSIAETADTRFPIFEVKDVDKKPAALFQTKPVYPYSMQQSKTRGKVVVEFVIGPDAKVSRIKAISSTHREFEQPAIDSIIRSTWKPAYKDEKPVATRVTQTISFTP